MDFDNYDRMKTCLKLYHHSNFDDGVSSARKINVELTYVSSHVQPHLSPFTPSKIHTLIPI